MLDANGFKRPTYDEILAELIEKAKASYGEDVNTSARSFLGIILRLFAWFLSKAWNVTENTYYSAYVNTAEGVQLDRLGPYVGIQRNLATWATGTIEITGTPNYTVPAGFRVSTESEIVFETLEDITLDASGQGSGEIQALEPGTGGNVAANTITVIVNPDANVSSVNNPSPTSGGQNKETDPEFRQRFALATAGGGAATIDSIRGALLRLPGVRAATVIENDTNTTDSDGRPPKSFEAYVLGGDPDEIAQTILDTKAAGIQTWGSESVLVNDISGNAHEIRFSFAQEVNIHIRATVETNTEYPIDGDDQLTTQFVQYIGGEAANGQIYVGLNMGEEVVHSKLIAAACRVPGIADVTIELSTDGVTWAASNVTVAANQVAQTSHALIQIQVVHA